MKNKFFVAAVVAFVFVLIACSDNGGNGALKKIVFMGVQSGSTNGDIYVMNEDGTNVTNLTNTSDKTEYYPKWSPDGKKIYFLKEESSKFYLYVMNGDGSDQVKITTQDVRSFSYDISPDGTKIVFTGNDGDNEIYVVNADGTGLTNLSDNTTDDVCPSWSPNGEWIAFLSKRDGGNYGLYGIRYDGTNAQRIGNYDDVQHPYTPQWSPDGHNIAFVRYGNYFSADNYEIFVKGDSFLNISQNNKNDYYPLWSPDGTKIIFSSERDGNFNIYLWSTSNTVPQRLTDSTAKDVQYCWSPDGTKIVFVSERDVAGRGQIYVMDADGSNQTRLIFDDTLDCSVPQWQP